MINIIKADIYRLLRTKTFYIAIAVMLFMIFLSIYNVEAGSIGLTMNGAAPFPEQQTETMHSELENMSLDEIADLSLSEYRRIMLNAENYELDKNIIAENINLYYIFIFIAAAVIASDLSSGCVKNTLSSSIGRNKYFFSKIIFSHICCVVILFANTFLSYFANRIFNSANISAELGLLLKITAMQIPAILALASILTGIAFIVKKTSIFNTIAIPFIMLAQLLLMGIVRISGVDNIMNYELQVIINRLAHDPTKEYIIKSYAVCAVIIIVTDIIGYICFKRSEIK